MFIFLNQKLDAKAKQCLFVGYDEHRKGWRCMDPVTKKLTISRDVVFDEISSLNSDQKKSNTDVFLDYHEDNSESFFMKMLMELIQNKELKPIQKKKMM